MMQFPVKVLTRWLSPVLLGIITAFSSQYSGKAADNIFLTYGPVKVTVTVDSLEKFAEDGTVSSNLELLFNLIGILSPAEREKLREILQFRADVNPIVVSRFFQSSIGENILAQAGYILNAPWEQSGKYGIRAALVEAALDPTQGLTLINFLKKYPTDIHFSGEKLEDRAKAVELMVKATEKIVPDLAALSAAEAKQFPIADPDLIKTLDPTQPGPYGAAPKTTWQLQDQQRNRQFYVDVYRPQRWKDGQTPVVIISHGLASRPEDFDVQAQKLASYGFLVALPQHPGSDYARAAAMLQGETRKPYLVSDFLDRPQDVSYVIDELERRNPSEFAGRLNLKRVGVAGHSFGGYTALALAGATIDWDYLAEQCQLGKGLPNTALLLQCDALNLPREDYQFGDRRVAAIVVNNPVNSSIFGINGLNQVTIPVVMMGGSYDPATPFVLEQARSFPRLGSQEKYLTLTEGQAHVDFSKLDASISNLIQSLDNVTLPDPQLLHTYKSIVAIPFLQVHIAQDKRYQPYLDFAAAYSQLLSENEQFKFYSISQKSNGQLIDVINTFRRAHNLPIPTDEYPLSANVAAP